MPSARVGLCRQSGDEPQESSMGYFQRLLLDQLETDDEFRLDFEDEEIWRLEPDFPETTTCTAFNEEF